MTDSHEEIHDLYTKVKNLLKSSQFQEARKLLQLQNLEELWENLLRLSMERRNCPVTKLILVVMTRMECLSKEELLFRISKIDHGIQVSFVERLNEYIETSNFELEYHKYVQVRAAVAAHVKGRLGGNLVNPRFFHANSGST